MSDCSLHTTRTKDVAQLGMRCIGTDTSELVHFLHVHNDETDALDLKQIAIEFVVLKSS